MLTKSINLTKISCFCLNNVLIKSFADISTENIHFNFMMFSFLFCFNQWLWISTCFNRVFSLTSFSFTKQIVWRLSHWIISCFWKFNLIARNNLIKNIAFLMMKNKINNSISVLNVMIVNCLQIFHETKSSNSFIMNFWKIFWFELSANDTSFAQTNVCYFDLSVSYWIVRNRVKYRYFITRSTAKWFLNVKLIFRCFSLDAANATFDLMIMKTKKMKSIFFWYS